MSEGDRYLLGRVEELQAKVYSAPDVIAASVNRFDRSSKDAEVMSERKRAKAEARISSLEAEVARLREGLRKYGRHGMAGAPCSGPCAEWQTGEKSCTCGLDSLLSGSGEGA